MMYFANRVFLLVVIILCLSWGNSIHALDTNGEPSAEELNSLSITQLIERLDQYDHAEPDLAIIYGQAALARIEQDVSAAQHANILNHLGWAYTRLGNFERAIELQTEALALADANNLLEERAFAFNLAGVIKRQQGYYPEAISLYQKALRLREQLGDVKAIANTHNNLGVVHNIVGEYYQAIDHLNRSVEYKQQIHDDLGIANTLNNIANIYLNANEVEKSKQTHMRSLAIREQLGVDSAIAESLNSLGMLYLQERDYLAATNYFNRALELNQRSGIKRAVRDSLQNLGTLAANQGQSDKAVDSYQQALAISDELSDDAGSIQLQIKIAKLLSESQQHSEAIALLSDSLILAQRIDSNELLELVHSELAQTQIAAANFEVAYEHAITSLALANDLKNDLRRQSAYFTLSKIFEEKGGTEKALEYFTEYKRVSDKLVQEQTQQLVRVAQSKYNYQLERRENERLKHENALKAEQLARIAAEKEAVESKKLVEQGFIAGVFVVLLLVMYLIFNHRVQLKRRLDDALLNKKIKQIEQSKNDFLNVVSHELLTPIHGIQSGVELVKSEGATTELLNILDQSTQRISSLVGDIIKYTQLRAQKGAVDFLKLPVSNVLDKLKAKYQQKCIDKSLSLDWQVQATDSALCKAEAVTTVCDKLLDNAVKFTVQGSISVRVADKPQGQTNGIEIAIKDSGIGIKQEHLTSIFELFHQERTGSTRRFEGMGLGLTLSEFLVKTIDGSIEVTSEQGKGTEFIFWFPVIEA